MSQQELAAATGLSRQTVAALESGLREPRWESRWKLSSFLGLDPAKLFGPQVDPEIRTDFRVVDADELAEILRAADAAGQKSVSWSVPPVDLAHDLDLPLDFFFEQRAKSLVSLGRAVAELERRLWVILVDYAHDSASAEVSVRLTVLLAPPKEHEA